MADDVSRWSVTYTKHKTQKRKVYQDGFLELQSSSHKVKLYDDCDKLLESKIVKLDDAVRSGETLTFGAYLVDIGDPHGESETKPVPNPILQRDKIMMDRKATPNNRTSMGRLHVRKGLSTNLSPSQKLIREFKRREVNIYSSSPSHPDTVKDDSTEWQVLYTTQLTQKAKKFHDGILKVAVSGLRGRQAVLYDETRRVLDSRFLKSEEIISAGDTMRFDGHIVDIVELKDDKPLKSINVDESNCYKQNAVQSKVQPDMKVWDVMYTAQVTQKAKKFHDGLLKLASSGSQGRQEVTLLAEDGTILSHRYLKLSEDINSGSSFNMTNYLVEVCESRKQSAEKCPGKASITENETPEIKRIDVDNTKLCKRFPAGDPMRFDGHIVDIIEQKDDKPLKSTNVDESNCYKQNAVQSKIQTNMKEWDVMYTAQVTQKAKKFQDGVLKLTSSGSQGRQEATLLAEDGTVLSHRYLKLSEDINSGSSFNMTNYLVEVCEPRKHSAEKCPRKVSTSENETPEIKITGVDNIKLCKRIIATKPPSDVKPPKGAFLLQDTELKVRKPIADEVISTTISKNKSLRDANSILSILKKPSTHGVSVEKVHLEAQQDSCSSRADMAPCNEETRVSSEVSTSNLNELAKEAKETKDQSNAEISGDNNIIDSRNVDFPSFDIGID
ncbi:hypothetical protein Hdeb2414_s0018g00534111 [Helianthus debilis subsp. tardiflorus]